jgi:hypothetical protein
MQAQEPTQASFGMLRDPTRDAMSWSELERLVKEGETDAALLRALTHCRCGVHRGKTCSEARRTGQPQ